MKKLLKKKFGFASYDFSNSGYVAVFQSFLFPLVIAEMLTTAGKNSEFYWAAVVVMSSILAIITAPFVGRLADKIGKVRVFCATVIFVGILASVAVPVFGYSVFVLLAVFVIFNWIFELSQSVYDSFLVDLSSNQQETTDISTFAWGFGYLGGATFAVLYFVMNKMGVAAEQMLTVFGVLFLLVSIPAMLFLSRTKLKSQPQQGFPKLAELLRVSNPVPWADIFVYWVIADTVAAILYFAPLYLKSELALSTAIIGGILLVGQLAAFPATIFMGRLSRRIGRIGVIRLGLAVWAIGLVGLYMASSLAHVIAVFLLLSLVVGSTQALLRAHFADRVEAGMSAEGLGFFAIAQKSASVIAPLLVVAVVYFSGSVGPAFLILAILLVVAFLLAGRLTEGVLE
jgi:UMF1 family MFS transporter